MSRWVFLNSRKPSSAAEKCWYWIHTAADDAEERSGPFLTLIECLEDARQHGFDEADIDVRVE
ncbi:MAG: hypothetical protein ACM3SS_02020 [Rhodospirillaceae bacterium]